MQRMECGGNLPDEELTLMFENMLPPCVQPEARNYRFKTLHETIGHCTDDTDRYKDKQIATVHEQHREKLLD